MSISRNILGLIIIGVLFSSCINKKQEQQTFVPDEDEVEVESQQQEMINESEHEKENYFNYSEFIAEKMEFFQTSYEYDPASEEIINLLYETEEEYLKGWVRKIIFTQKVNFGIPGGDNWLVQWDGRQHGTFKSDAIILYSISDKIENRYYISASIPLSDSTNYNIMENISGIHIENKGFSVFDFNGDGTDELFSYLFGGMGFYVGIYGYDPVKNDLVNYCDYINFSIIDKDNGPAPVEFTYYKNRYGFKVYGRYYVEIPPVNLIDRVFAWYFFSWNNETRQYENIGEYLLDANGVEMEIEYNPHNFSVDHFFNRIREERMHNMVSLQYIEEIDPKIEGGRSFKATIMAASPPRDIFEEICNFDSKGILRR